MLQKIISALKNRVFLKKVRKALKKRVFKKVKKIVKKRTKKIRKIIRKNIKKLRLSHIFGYSILLPISYLVPKQKNLVLLTTRFGDFDGNLKYLFLYLNNLDDQDFEFVFLTDQKHVYQNLTRSGYKAWLYPRFTTILKLFRVNILIVDGNEWAKKIKYHMLFKSKKVQIWHGTGMKTIGLLKPTIKNLSSFRQKLKKEYTYYDLLFLTSEYQVKIRGNAFRHGKLYLNGFPRNDIFFKEIIANNEVGSDNELLAKCTQYQEQGYSLVVYTPTWRKHDRELHLDLQTLDAFARLNKMIFIIKLHPKHACPCSLDDYSHIMEYNKKADVYPLLTVADALITDYSSIYLDYLLTDKPIFFYPYDSDEYIGGERALLIDYNEITPGPKCYTDNSLRNEVYRHLVMGDDRFYQQRKELQRKFFHYQDGESSARLWEIIKKDLLQRKSIGS